MGGQEDETRPGGSGSRGAASRQEAAAEAAAEAEAEAAAEAEAEEDDSTLLLRALTAKDALAGRTEARLASLNAAHSESQIRQMWIRPKRVVRPKSRHTGPPVAAFPVPSSALNPPPPPMVTAAGVPESPSRVAHYAQFQRCTAFNPASAAGHAARHTKLGGRSAQAAGNGARLTPPRYK